MSDDLADLSASEAARLVADGSVSPVQLVSAALDRVERHNETLNAVVTLNDRALAEARELEAALHRGVPGGPLCGVPIGIKDVTDVAGLRTTHGSPLYANHLARGDALVVERLRSAGAIVIGKTNTPEFAAGGNTYNDVFGRTRNPWDPPSSAGGSTGGGAAALASGMIAIAEGTDLGGSLRIPASFCGVVGLRPAPGVVPTWPTDWAWDDLLVSGPMARTAEDVMLALGVMAGPDPRAPLSGARVADGGPPARALDLAGLRLSYCPDPARVGTDPSIETRCASAARGLEAGGATVDEVDLDLSDAMRAFLHLRGVWMVTHHLDRLDRLDALGENVRGNVEAGLRVTAEQIAWAHRTRSESRALFGRLLEACDFLLTPTMAVPPFPVERNYPDSIGGRPTRTYVDWIAPTAVLSLTGLPVASVPCGLDERGLPVGLQVVGPPGAEMRVLALCARIQEMQPLGPPPLA